MKRLKDYLSINYTDNISRLLHGSIPQMNRRYVIYSIYEFDCVLAFLNAPEYP